MYLPCTDFDPCLFRHETIGFRPSHAKDIYGTMTVVPLEEWEDLDQIAFAAGKGAKFEGEEETVVETMFAELVEEDNGLITTLVREWPTYHNPGNPTPWHPGWAPFWPPTTDCCGKTIVITPGPGPGPEPQPAPIPLPPSLAGALVGVIALGIIKRRKTRHA